jgi:hypothetical protein
MDQSRNSKRLGVAFLFSVLLLGVMVIPTLAAPPVKGAIFTTDGACQKVNGNIYSSVFGVFLDGGPAKPGAAGLPNGDYYVKVTEPNGRLLGTSIGSGNDKPVHVANGEFSACLNLFEIVVRASDGTYGFDNTGNAGGEYKVWVSNEASFANNSSKTDNFQVKPGPVIGPE